MNEEVEVEVLERLATLPRRYTDAEVRFEIQQVKGRGRPFLSVRVWKPAGAGEVPYRGQGCSF